MYRARLTYYLLFLLLAGLALVGCGPSDSIDPALEPASTPAPDPAGEAAATPQQVCQSFFDWYLDSLENRSDGAFVNPLAAGLYRDSEYLTAGFVAQIDEILNGFDDKGGYDPILQAQDVPERIKAQEPAQNGSEATVIVLRYWSGNPEPSPITVHLIETQGGWKIDNITAFETPQMGGIEDPETPEAVVSSFYDWYLGYIGDPASDGFRNPLVDRAYRDAPYLGDSLVGHIDELLAGMGETGGYDPFLCAQAIPAEIIPDTTFARNGMASVTARSSFANQMFTVDLRPEGASWLITNITCASDPAGVASTFYSWYLGTIGDRSAGEFHNPFSEQLYRGHPLLSDSLVASIDERLAGMGPGGYDPFLLAQDVPSDFSVDPGVAGGTAVVHLQFGSDSVRHVLVTLDESGRQIDAISENELLPGSGPESAPAGETTWAVSVNDDYGFSFAYPADWVLQEPSINRSEIPADWPVQALWLLMPADVAEFLGSQTGTPDPNAAVIVAPFNIEVLVGDAAAVERVYGDLAGAETKVVSGSQAISLHREPGYTHVVIAHPKRPDTWIILTDWVTQFPGREAQAQVAAPHWEPLLNGLQFTG